MDDYDRHGERETVNELLKMFKNKKIDIFRETYKGIKSVTVIGTKKYKYVASL